MLAFGGVILLLHVFKVGNGNRMYGYTTDTDIRIKLQCRITSRGAEFRGTLSHTLNNRECQHWVLQSPHKHPFLDASYFSDATLLQAKNYCRNPGGVKEQPWCFTNDPNIRWEYCNIPLCGCKKSKSGKEYLGSMSTTVSGRSCQRWDAQAPHSHSYHNASLFPDRTLLEAANFCRNPSELESEGPWCYVDNADIRWEYCDVPYCECKISTAGREYGGRISHTITGKTCQRWDSHIPHKHRYYDACDFPERNLEEASNYCRNPDIGEEVKGPWCFTTDPNSRWEYCDVNFCEGIDQYGTKSPPHYFIEPKKPDGILPWPNDRGNEYDKESMQSKDSGGSSSSSQSVNTSLFVVVSIVAILALIAIIILTAVIVWMKLQNKRMSKRVTSASLTNNSQKMVTVEYRNGRGSSFENPVYNNRLRQSNSSEHQQLRSSTQSEPRYTLEPTIVGSRYIVETIHKSGGVESEYRFEPVSPTKSMNCYAEIDQIENVELGIGGRCTRI